MICIRGFQLGGRFGSLAEVDDNPKVAARAAVIKGTAELAIRFGVRAPRLVPGLG